MSNCVVLWSAWGGALTGQSLVTERVANHQCQVMWVMATYRPGLRGWASVLRALFRLYRAVFFGGASVIYVVCSRSLLGFVRDVPALVLAMVGFRVVVHVHGSDLPALLAHKALGWLARALYGRCEIIVPSAHLVTPLRDLGCRRIHVIENFALAAGFAGSSEVRSGVLRVLWNSNLLASKGVRELVAGARLARSRGVLIEMIILGRPMGDLAATEREMREFVASLAAEPWINVRGAVAAAVAAQSVMDCDLVALPSRNECQPLALVQAMCAGKKIIVADTAALRATVADYPATFCASDAEAIARALIDAARSQPVPEVASAAARRRFSASRFDAELAAVLVC